MTARLMAANHAQHAVTYLKFACCIPRQAQNHEKSGDGVLRDRDPRAAWSSSRLMVLDIDLTEDLTEDYDEQASHLGHPVEASAHDELNEVEQRLQEVQVREDTEKAPRIEHLTRPGQNQCYYIRRSKGL